MEYTSYYEGEDEEDPDDDGSTVRYVDLEDLKKFMSTTRSLDRVHYQMGGNAAQQHPDNTPLWYNLA